MLQHNKGRHMAKKMDDKEFCAQLSRMISDAKDSDLEQRRTELYKMYLGEPIDEGEKTTAGSKFVSSDVADFVESLLPDIMEPFVSGDNVIEFAPIGADDEAGAEQETSVIRHLFWDKNPGFTNLYQFTKEALMQQNSYMEHGWEDKERTSVEVYEDLTLDELIGVHRSLEADYDVVEVIDQSGGEIDPETGEAMPVDVSFRCTTKSKEYVIECFPQEEFFVTAQWSKIGLQEAPCCGRRKTMSITELESMGFDVTDLEGDDSEGDDTQTQDRFDTDDYQSADTDAATREFTGLQVIRAHGP